MLSAKVLEYLYLRWREIKLTIDTAPATWYNVYMKFKEQRKYLDAGNPFWDDETGHYRIRGSIYLEPLQYYTTFLAHGVDGEYWEVAGPMKPYRTFKAAERVTAQHKLFWERMLSVQELKGKKREERFVWVMEKQYIGRGKSRVGISGSIPTHIYEKLEAYLKGKLTPRKRKKGRK